LWVECLELVLRLRFECFLFSCFCSSFNQLVSFSSDAERGRISQMILPAHTGESELLPSRDICNEAEPESESKGGHRAGSAMPTKKG
jgi:hypothetical protein